MNNNISNLRFEEGFEVINQDNWFIYFQNEYNQTYFNFIENCKNKKYSETTQMHTHHIIPKYLLKSTPEEISFCDSMVSSKPKKDPQTKPNLTINC